MNRSLVAAPLLCVWTAVAGCSSVEPANSAPAAALEPSTLTAEQAKEAVLELVRSHPGVFIGSPDPDRLEQCSLREFDDDEWSFGAFVVDLRHRNYWADIGEDEMYHYYGSIQWREGRWVAGEPELQRFHRRRGQ
jgi:hypothetical protein